jgi:uncharacterized repeat protein (TIGR01451 family)
MLRSPTGRLGLRTLQTVLAITAVVATLLALTAGSAFASSSPALHTDQDDYVFESTVHVSGEGFDAGSYAVPVLRPDGTIVVGDGSFAPGWDIATAGADGTLAYDYQLDSVDGTYEVRAYPADWSGDWGQAPIADWTFHDAGAAANLDQCRNGPFSAPVACTGSAWVNANANSTQAHYREGDSLPYRMKLSGIDTSASHTLTIEWDTTKGGKHAIDYLTTYNRTELAADPCSGIAGCGAATTFPIPVDTNVTGAGIPQAAGNFTCFNCTISAASAYTVSGSYAGDSSTRITLTFTATNETPVIAWGGHIGAQFDWGDGEGAGSLSGSPYHTRLIDLDNKGGNQDRALMADAVAGPPTIDTEASVSTISPGDSVTDTATLSGAHGAVTGTVAFFVCGPSATPPDCTTGGTQVGGNVTVAGGQALSDAFTPGIDPSAAGTYCFRAEYTPDASAQYSIGKHTNVTTECFTQLAASIDITKVADATSVSQGDPIGFTITVTSGGPGEARDVTVDDPLPTAGELDWTVDGGTGAALCVIVVDDLQCSFGNMASGAFETIHISSPTTDETKGLISNTATANTSNAGSDQATATVYVYCTTLKMTQVADSATVTHGGTIGFTITIKAQHGGVAREVYMVDTLSAKRGLSWSIDDATSTPGCSISGSTMTCDFGDLASGNSVSVHITSPTRAAVGTVKNSASCYTEYSYTVWKSRAAVNVV